MAVKILVMGREQNYHEAEVNRDRLQKEISKMSGWIKEEELLYNLRNDNGIPAKQLRNYGSTISLKEMTIENETLIVGLERFFEKAKEYAEKHGAHYVLIQDLDLGRTKFIRNFDIKGLTQLLIE